MNDADLLPQLSFQINNLYNGGIGNIIYLTPQADLNHLQLIITTNVAGTVFTVGNGPVPLDKAQDATGSLLYLDLSALNLSSIDIKTFSAPGWNFQLYQDQICMYIDPAAKSVPLPSNSQIVIDIAGMAVTQPPSGSGNPYLYVKYYRVQNVNQDPRIGIRTPFMVIEQNPPQGKDNLQKSIQLRLSPASIVNSLPNLDPTVNSLTIDLSPITTISTISAGPSTYFTVFFIYSDTDPYGFGALTTPANARNFQFTTVPIGWIPKGGSDLPQPCWKFQVPEGQVLFGSQSVIELVIENITTSFQPGPTLVYVHYEGITGYVDGCFCQSLQKVEHIKITSLTITKDPVELTKNDNKLSAIVTVSWETNTTPDYLYLSAPRGQSCIVTGTTSHSLTITNTSPISLNAQKTVASNQVTSIVNAHVLPVIHSFKAYPTSVYYKDFNAYPVDLSWDIATNEYVTLSTKDGNISTTLPSNQTDSQSYSYGIQIPQTLTISPNQATGDSFSIEQSLTISAFQMIPKDTNTEAQAFSYLAISPTAEFIAVTNTDNKAVSILNTLNYKVLDGINPIPVGQKPLGITFSHDGACLFVANSGDGTISVIKIAPTGSIPAYSFSVASPISIGGSPQQIALSPDDSYLFVTVDQGTSSAGSLVILQNKGNYNYKPLQTLTVGIAPRGIAVKPSGDKVFIANSLSNTVSVFGKSNDQFIFSRTIEHLPSPIGIAAAISPTQSPNSLLICCSGNNQIYVCDPDSYEMSPPLSVEKPMYIALLPSLRYAFVTNNQASGTVSFLGWNNSRWEVKETIECVSNPIGIAASPEEGVVLVAGGTSSLSILTLATYLQQGILEPTLEAPSDLMITSDNRKVFVWHNYSKFTPGTDYQGGISVYDIEQQIVEQTTPLANNPIISCVTAPKLNTAFVIMLSDKDPSQTLNSVTMLSTLPDSHGQYNSIGTLNLPPQPTSLNQAQFPKCLALSKDGLKLFVITQYEGSANQFGLVVFDLSTDQHEIITNILIANSDDYDAPKLCVRPDGSQIFVLFFTSTVAQMIILQQNGPNYIKEQISPLHLVYFPKSMQITDEGNNLLILGNDSENRSSIWKINTTDFSIQQITLPTDLISLYSMAISHDGTKLYLTDSSIAGLRVLDTVSLRFIQTIFWPFDASYPREIALLPDSSQIFVVFSDTNNLGIIQCVVPLQTRVNIRDKIKKSLKMLMKLLYKDTKIVKKY